MAGSSRRSPAPPTCGRKQRTTAICTSQSGDGRRPSSRTGAARADWSVKPYGDANHPPVVALGGSVDVDAAPSQTVKLDLSASTDPDGDGLRFQWWQYREPGSYKGEVSIKEPGAAATSVTVPADAKAGDTVHLIGQVTDSGKPPLTRYTRVIVTVRAAPRTSTTK